MADQHSPSRNELASACEALLDYRNRNGANWQMEKADDFFRRIRIELDLLSAAPSERTAIPEGWKLVPVELTDDMRGSLAASMHLYGLTANEWQKRVRVGHAWSDVLAAVQALPSTEREPDGPTPNSPDAEEALLDLPEAKKRIDQLEAHLEEIYKAIGFSKERFQQTGDSPFDCIAALKALPNAVGETPRTDAIAPHLNLSHQDMRRVAWALRDLSRQLERELFALSHGGRKTCS